VSLLRPFRFGSSSHATATAAEYAEAARRVEALGYDTFVTPDHFEQPWFTVGPALVAAAYATTTFRVGSLDYCGVGPPDHVGEGARTRD
jgi:alkanesulfonate monooxygenase SsuD/methylene tetrahydromethanopterin reductase-like flavin-dependent oxidoreductase (luciferase family)